ncbi:MAG: 50S ribosomal protein L32 [Desulfatitalea sp. BRH_c12]|jgi:large subunit ribosomal protein L32|nr:MAG: 50S ribosomal protein L32 [Desulfatitalea sp. BRH_c12]
MGLPKHKISKSRRDKRRTHQKVDVPNIVNCPECGEAIQPHHACSSCGAYKGRTAVETDKE